MIVVTGATGFVGATLVRQLIEGDEPVRILRRASSSLDLLGDAAHHVEHVLGDVTDPDAVHDAIEGARIVYHAAAVVAFGRQAWTRQWNTNVVGTANVVNAALAAGVDRLVHTSSIAALGRPVRPAGMLDETARWRGTRVDTGYARSKHEAEREVHRGVAEGLDAVMVNPAVVFGPGRSGEGSFALAERVARGRAVAPPGGTAIVDVADVAAGLRLAAASGETGERYILAAENRSWADILGTLAAALGVARPRTAPAALVSAGAGVAEAWSRITRTDPLLTRQQALIASTTYRYDGSRATRDLGLDYRPFEDTASRIAQAIRQRREQTQG
ncbi:MAG: NAD-dependent epimerase/dehydratase family protein [Bacteroidota bacterium]